MIYSFEFGSLYKRIKFQNVMGASLGVNCKKKSLMEFFKKISNLINPPLMRGQVAPFYLSLPLTFPPYLSISLFLSSHPWPLSFGAFSTTCRRDMSAYHEGHLLLTSTASLAASKQQLAIISRTFI